MIGSTLKRIFVYLEGRVSFYLPQYIIYSFLAPRKLALRASLFNHCVIKILCALQTQRDGSKYSIGQMRASLRARHAGLGRAINSPQGPNAPTLLMVNRM